MHIYLIKKLMYLRFLVLVVLIPFSIKAQDVYLNNFNNDFHTLECPLLNTKHYIMTIKDALDAKYTACTACNPSMNTSTQNTPLIFSDSVVFDTIITKDFIYNKTKNWLLGNMEDLNFLITQENVITGNIKGKGSFPLLPNSINSTDSIYFNLDIEIKEDTFRYKFFDFEHKTNNLTDDANLGVVLQYFDRYKTTLLFDSPKKEKRLWLAVLNKIQIEILPKIFDLNDALQTP